MREESRLNDNISFPMEVQMVE